MKLLLPHPAAVEFPLEVLEGHYRGHIPPGRRLRGLDLGDDHYLELSHGYEMPEDECVGGTITHKKPDGSWCQGWIGFVDGFGPPTWSVESWDPLSCSPSFLCHCGDHGFIKGGRWVRA